jgi:guanine nucleotide exchange factor VAV
VLKYHLLLHELLRQTPDSAPEAQSALRIAYEHMIDLGQFINEVKRDAETLQIIADIERSITDLEMPEQTQLQDYGRLVRDGELKVRAHDDHKLRPRYVFVFDKVLLMCKAMRGDQYSYRQALILLDYELCDQLPVALLAIASNGTTPLTLPSAGQHAFFLVHQLQHHVFTFFAKSEEQKLHWMSSLRRAMETASPMAPGANQACSLSGSSPAVSVARVHSYIMATFESPAHCDHCGRLLKGKFFQGYRCVQCALQVHLHCISNTGRCGLPPQLPPRRTSPSHTLPSNARITQCPLPPPPPVPIGSTSPARHFPNESTYENLRLDGQPWFAGQMDRESAQRTLRSLSHGSFLVRVSNKQRGSYALSLNDSGEVKHMRIVCTESGRFYLSQSKSFDSILQLIRWYEQHSLAESFVGLDITLGRPFRAPDSSPNVSSSESNGSPQDFSNQSYSCVSPTSPSATIRRSDSSCQTESSPTATPPPPPPPPPLSHSIGCISSNSAGSNNVLSVARALYRFTGETGSLLSFQKGDVIEVLSKAGEKKGWWKGRVEGRIGYFPYKYVTELLDPPA